MKMKKIEVMTAAGLISFHVNADDIENGWMSFEGKIVFTKLSGQSITFVESNVIYINEISVNDNSGGDSVE